jgi:hypothetical protein
MGGDQEREKAALTRLFLRLTSVARPLEWFRDRCLPFFLRQLL